MNSKVSPRSFSVLAALACAVILLCSIPLLAQNSLQTLSDHVRPEVANGQAQMLGPLPTEHRLHLSIVLPLRNQSELNDLLSQLYDPQSAEYRQFLSVAEFTERFSPTVEDYQTVVDFAKASGFTVIDTPANRLIVPVTGTAAQVENAFHLNMNVYQHPTENRVFYSPDREPSLALTVPVTHISGLNDFSIPRPALKRAAEGLTLPNITGSGPGGTSYLASDMRAAYYGGTALTGSGQSVGLMEFGGYSISDVVSTFDGKATEAANGSNYIITYTVGSTKYSIQVNNVLLDGASAGPANEYDAEQVLDVVQPIGMAPGLSQVRVYIAPDVFTTSGNYIFPESGNDTLIFNTMASDNICKQLSISWNWRPESITTNDAVFQELAAQGQSVFAASGDSGSWPNSAYYYPEEDAYVIAVGGTDLTTTAAGGAWSSETGWADSGGGVSPDDVTLPSWQSGLNGVNSSSKTYRNAPDVAMEGNFDNYVCGEDDGPSSCAGDWGGTSFAAPRWAGYMALVNQQAVSAGKGTIGFANPSIYTIGEGSSYHTDFHDITSGSNGSHSAASGYDLVTGWGSPNGANLITALVAADISAAPAPTYSTTAAPGPETCGNELTGFDEPCYITWTSTITVVKGETLYVNGSVVTLTNGTTYVYIVSEEWGTGECENTPDGFLCFGFGTPPSITVYATEPGDSPSANVVISF